MQNLRGECHKPPRPETGGHLFGLNYPDLLHLITLPPISCHLSSDTVSKPSGAPYLPHCQIQILHLGLQGPSSQSNTAVS